MTDMLSFFLDCFIDVISTSYFQAAFSFVFVIGLFNIVKRLSNDSF